MCNTTAPLIVSSRWADALDQLVLKPEADRDVGPMQLLLPDHVADICDGLGDASDDLPEFLNALGDEMDRQEKNFDEIAANPESIPTFQTAAECLRLASLRLFAACWSIFFSLIYGYLSWLSLDATNTRHVHNALRTYRHQLLDSAHPRVLTVMIWTLDEMIALEDVVCLGGAETISVGAEKFLRTVLEGDRKEESIMSIAVALEIEGARKEEWHWKLPRWNVATYFFIVTFVSEKPLLHAAIEEIVEECFFRAVKNLPKPWEVPLLRARGGRVWGEVYGVGNPHLTVGWVSTNTPAPNDRTTPPTLPPPALPPPLHMEEEGPQTTAQTA